MTVLFRVPIVGLVVLAFVSSVNLVYAEETDDQRVREAAIEFLSVLDKATPGVEPEEACRADLESRAKLYDQENVAELKPMELVLEAQRLKCEALRTEAEILRLAAERLRLLDEAKRLDEAWKTANGKDPEAFPDNPGRDRSQRIMRADARAIAFTMRSLSFVIDDLQSEAVRLLVLAHADLKRFADSHGVELLAAVDSESKQSLFDRFREELPKQG